MSSALDGIRVLDFSSGVAGPVAAMLLADHGADAVKIEPPGGDPFRGTPGYATWLRGRRSAVLDLQDPADRDDLPRPGAARPTSSSRASRRASPTDSASTRDAAGREPTPRATAPSPRTVRRLRSGTAPGYDALVAARCGTLHEQRGHLGGAMTHMNREEPYLPDLEIPEGMEPGSPRNGPDLHVHAVAELLRPPSTPRSGSTPRSSRVSAPGVGNTSRRRCCRPRSSLTASKWMRAENSDAAGFRTWMYDRRATKGFFQCSDGRWVQQWVPNPAFVLSSADGDTLDAATRRRPPPTIPTASTPDPENIIVLAHYFPLMAEAFARFPSDEWVARRGRSRRAAAAGPHARGGAGRPGARGRGRGRRRRPSRPRHAAPGRASSTDSSETPGARRPGRSPESASTPTDVRAEAATAVRRTRASTPTAAAPRRCRPRSTASRCWTSASPSPVRSAPSCLADLGANVIKVNALRDPFWHANHIAYGANRGKRSIGIDLKTPTDSRCSIGSSSAADVVHSNMRRDALAPPADRRSVAAGGQPRHHLLPHTRLRPRAPLATRPATTRPAARSPASPTRTAAATTADARSGASRRSATPATGSCPPSA